MIKILLDNEVLAECEPLEYSEVDTYKSTFKLYLVKKVKGNKFTGSYFKYFLRGIYGIITFTMFSNDLGLKSGYKHGDVLNITFK